MAQVSISEAARLTKRSRTTIYRYRDDGKLSFSTDTQGNPAIDTSELMRVFGEISLNRSELSREDEDEHHVTHELNNVHAELQRENNLLSETINRLEREIEEAHQRELWLQNQMERLTSLLSHAQPTTDQRSQSSPWWKFWK